MHAPNPAQQEAFGLYILQLDGSEQLDVERFQFLVDDGEDSLQDGRVVLRIRVDDSLQIGISLSFIHLVLDVHYLLKHAVDVGFRVLNAVEEDVQVFISRQTHRYYSVSWAKPQGVLATVYTSWKYTYTIEARTSFMPCLQETSGFRLHHTKRTVLRSLMMGSCWKNYCYWYVLSTSFLISFFRNSSSTYVAILYTYSTLGVLIMAFMSGFLGIGFSFLTALTPLYAYDFLFLYPSLWLLSSSIFFSSPAPTENTPISIRHTLNLHLRSSRRQLRMSSDNFYLFAKESTMQRKNEDADAEKGIRLRAFSNFQLLAMKLQFIINSITKRQPTQTLFPLTLSNQVSELFANFLSTLQSIRCWRDFMDAQMIQLLAAEVTPHHNILKEVDPAEKRQIFQAFDQRTPLIIQYGSETTKVGYESFRNPNLVFRPQISKTRDPNKGELPIKSVINLSYDQLDFNKSNYKSPFQKNIILHFSILEQCNDYIFSQTLRPGKKSQSALIISEPFANPIHCRSSILGQLFECYGFNEILLGVDALFAYFYEVNCQLERYLKETAIVVSMGANTIHVFCIVEGKVQYNSIRRINVGGNNAFELFSRTILLKNPQLKNKLTYSFLRDIYEKYTQVAYDYTKQLRHFQKVITSKKSIKEPQNNQIYHNLAHQHNREYQFSTPVIEVVEIDFDVIVEIPEEQIKRKEEMKIRMAEKLRETIERRKQLKKKMHEHELKQLLDLKQKYEGGDKEAHEEVVQMFGTSKFFDKLLKKIHNLEIKLGIAEEKPEENKFSLIDVPDHELTSQKLKLKRIQLYQKNMIEVKRRKQEERLIEEQKMKDLRENNPQTYLQQLKEKYKNLSEKAKENERIKNELNSRKSRLKQKRMQVLARLAEEDYDENNVENEEDMQALKDPEESDHYSELEVMEAELREIDPEWNSSKKDIHHLNSSNQLFMSVELVKCHQIYFEPRIAGCQQAGLIETIKCSVQQFPTEVRQKLLRNIVVVGGGSVIPGLKQRIEKDLMQQCPTGSQIKVTIGKGGYLGAYYGMQNIARMPKKETASFFYRSSHFNQLQANQYKENPWSNPKPQII